MDVDYLSIVPKMEITSESTGATAGGQPEPGLQVPIPVIFLPEHTTEKPLQACRACLLTDCRLYSMEQCNLTEMFKQLTGLQLLDDKYPTSLCAECATFLINCKRFREKSLTVQKTLNVLSNTTRIVSIEKLKQLRKVKKLSSNLSVKQTCLNYYDTEIDVSEDYVEESPTNLKVELIDAVSSNTLVVTQNPSNNSGTDIDACEVGEEQEIPISEKGVKIKTEITKGCETNSAKREHTKLSSNSFIKQNPLKNFDTDMYDCEDDREETPINVNGKRIKTELTSDNVKREKKTPSKLSVKKNSPNCSDNPCITYAYEYYEENTKTTLNDNIITVELFRNSSDIHNDKITTETNHEQAEVKVSKELNQKKQKVEFKKTGDGSKPVTKTAKKSIINLYNCEQCDTVLKSKPVYLSHLRSEHHSTHHVCRICGLSFINRRSLGMHQTRQHVIDNSDVPDDGPCCPECSLHFLSEEALQTHLGGTLKVRRISGKRSDSELDEDLNTEISDSPDNVEHLKSELESDEGEKDNAEKTSTKIIMKSISTRKCRPRKVPFGPKSLILKNMIVAKRLTLKEQMEVVQRRKEKNKDKPYKCDICSFGTLSKKMLETHLIRHSEEMGALSCNLCHFRFKKSKAYHSHKFRHAYMYSCVKCPFTTYMHHLASKHVAQFHERQIYTCGKCGKVYRCVSSYYDHQKIKHPSSEHVCCLCGYSFVSKTGMESHHLAKHLQESIEMPTLADGPSCAECSLRFMNEKALQTHMSVSHTTGTGKKMLNSASDPRPKYAVKEKKVVCETCGKLVNGYHLKYHLEEHAGKTFPCSICGETFPTKTKMYNHKFFTHGKGKDYKQRVKVRKEERAQCKVCGKTYSSKRNLKKHEDRTHSGNIVHCDHCDKQFSCVENLKQHVDHVHLNKPWNKRLKRRAR